MKTYKIVGRTNGWIAQRDIQFNGNTCIIIANNLSLRQAQKKLLEMYNLDYDDEIGMPYRNWGLVRCNDNRTCSYADGTRSYEYDSRYYGIEEEEEESEE